jgi:hypothetical protein
MGMALSFIAVWASPALAYRPYDSTDADVAEQREVEVEIGWERLRMDGGEQKSVRGVVNIGVGELREIVIEGSWNRAEVAAGESSSYFSGVALLLKQVHRRGFLQGAPGLSVASECGILIPATSGESGPGTECSLIASAGNAVLNLHMNAGVAYETDHRWTHSFSLILEGSGSWRLRPGLELVREQAEGEPHESSLLAGLVWESSEGIAFDLAFRQNLDRTTDFDDWRIGMTWSH